MKRTLERARKRAESIVAEIGRDIYLADGPVTRGVLGTPKNRPANINRFKGWFFEQVSENRRRSLGVQPDVSSVAYILQRDFNRAGLDRDNFDRYVIIIKQKDGEDHYKLTGRPLEKTDGGKLWYVFSLELK